MAFQIGAIFLCVTQDAVQVIRLTCPHFPSLSQLPVLIICLLRQKLILYLRLITVLLPQPSSAEIKGIGQQTLGKTILSVSLSVSVPLPPNFCCQVLILDFESEEEGLSSPIVSRHPDTQCVRSQSQSPA